MVENCDTMLEILHKHKAFERIRDHENCDVRVFFWWRFFSWPRNYYNDNNFYNHGMFKYDMEKLKESKKLLWPILALSFL